MTSTFFIHTEGSHNTTSKCKERLFMGRLTKVLTSEMCCVRRQAMNSPAPSPTCQPFVGSSWRRCVRYLFFALIVPAGNEIISLHVRTGSSKLSYDHNINLFSSGSALLSDDDKSKNN